MRRFLEPDVEDLYAAGLAMRKQVLGGAHVARATAAATDFDRDFQIFITRLAWGGVWTRPGLDRHHRLGPAQEGQSRRPDLGLRTDRSNARGL